MTSSITYPAPKDGSAVSIAGDFNDWKPELMQLSADGTTYSRQFATKDMKDAEYKYKFVLPSGEWVLQEGRPTVADENGVLNHKMTIESPVLENMLDEAAEIGEKRANHEHNAGPEATAIPNDLGSEVIAQKVSNNEYSSKDKPNENSGPGLVDGDDIRTTIGERASPTPSHESHLNPAAPAFNPSAQSFIPTAQPFIPASNPPRQSFSHTDGRNSHHRQRSQSRTRKSHSRSSSIVSQRHRSNSSIHHDELNPTASEFKPQFGQPTNHVPHASGYAAALKKPSSPTIKDDFKKPHLPNKTTSRPSSAKTEDAETDIPTPIQPNDDRSNNGISYAAVAKHTTSEAHDLPSPATAISKSSEASSSKHNLRDQSALPQTSSGQNDLKLAPTPSLKKSEEEPQHEDKNSVESEPTAAAHANEDYKPSEDVRDRLEDSVSEKRDDSIILGDRQHRVDNVESSVSSTLSSLPEDIGEAVADQVNGADSTIDSLKEKTASLTESLRSSTSDMAGKLREESAVIQDQVQNATENASAALSESLSSLAEKEHSTSSADDVTLDTIKLSSSDYDAEQIRLMEEVCIMLDRDDYPIGSASKKDAHLMTNINQGLLHRAFSLFIFNSEKKLLLQQRASEKITFPNMWTNTCCSHPLDISGEVAHDLEGSIKGVKRAAQRKVDQELGIAPSDAPTSQMTFLTRIHYLAPSDGQWGEHEIDYILFLKSDPKLQVNPNEVRDHKWVSQAELREMFRSTSLSYTPWFKLICETFLFKWWDELDNLENCKDEGTIHRMKLDPELFAKIKHFDHSERRENSAAAAGEAQVANSIVRKASELVDAAATTTESLAEQASNVASSASNGIRAIVSQAQKSTSDSPASLDKVEDSAEPAAEDSQSPKKLITPPTTTSAANLSEVKSTVVKEADMSSLQQNAIEENAEPAGENSEVPVTKTPDPVDAEIRDSFNATQTEADASQTSQAPDAVLHLSPAGEAKFHAQTESSAAPVGVNSGDEQVSARPDSGRSLRAKQNFFFYIFNSLFGGIFKGFSSIFSKLAFWRKSPHPEP